MTAHPHFAALDRLKTRIQGLRSKTMDNGCTEAEALLAATSLCACSHGRHRIGRPPRITASPARTARSAAEQEPVVLPPAKAQRAA
jgi:hypothetical protein